MLRSVVYNITYFKLKVKVNANCRFCPAAAQHTLQTEGAEPLRQPLSLRSTEARLPERLPKAHPPSGETEPDAGRTEQATCSGGSSDNLSTKNRQRTDSRRALQGLWVGYFKGRGVQLR